MTELTRTELRLPTELHEQLRQAAFEQHTSLNGLICSLIIQGLDAQSGSHRSPAAKDN